MNPAPSSRLGRVLFAWTSAALLGSALAGCGGGGGDPGSGTAQIAVVTPSPTPPAFHRNASQVPAEGAGQADGESSTGAVSRGQ